MAHLKFSPSAAADGGNAIQAFDATDSAIPNPIDAAQDQPIVCAHDCQCVDCVAWRAQCQEYVDDTESVDERDYDDPDYNKYDAANDFGTGYDEPPGLYNDDAWDDPTACDPVYMGTYIPNSEPTEPP